MGFVSKEALAAHYLKDLRPVQYVVWLQQVHQHVEMHGQKKVEVGVGVGFIWY